MDTELLINQGNEYRAQRRPDLALQCYAQVFVTNPDHVGAWNNYGNVIREMGYPKRSIPFLQHALELDPSHEQANFNLAVSYLLMGDYDRGWPQYEQRWQFEHLKGTLPSWPQPRWTGQDLKGKTVLVLGEQGLGDCIQFARFAIDLKDLGASVIMVVPDPLITLFGSNDIIQRTQGFADPLPEFDYWVPIMSIPGVLKMDLDRIPKHLCYVTAPVSQISGWNQRLGARNRLRVGFSWSGRRDTWINQHKSVPFDQITDLVRRCPQYQWVNLQVDATPEESAMLESVGVSAYPGTVSCMADSAALYACLDVIVSVDTSVSHLSAAMGRPTWIMLNHYATDWRWLLDRGDSPWYPSARLFRQPAQDQWTPVLDKIERFLKVFTI